MLLFIYISMIALFKRVVIHSEDGGEVDDRGRGTKSLWFMYLYLLKRRDS